jgi:DNA-binding NarL/FixJ family response regulator
MRGLANTLCVALFVSHLPAAMARAQSVPDDAQPPGNPLPSIYGGPRAGARSRLARLTPREREVLDLLVEGLSQREIASRLTISPRTVEVYKARMMEKLQCRSLAELIRVVL